MFMEYCNEGTLWSIAQQGLTENMTRHYTKDIVKAVMFLHENGIVHRDIKGVCARVGYYILCVVSIIEVKSTLSCLYDS